MDSAIDFNDVPPNQDIVSQRWNAWENIFAKYSTCNDNDEKGMEWTAMDTFEPGEDEERDSDNNDSDEDFFEEPPTKKELEMLKERGNLQLVPANVQQDHNQNYERLTYYFSPQVIENLKLAFQNRAKELDKENLPFWKTSEISRSHETFHENFITTPEFSSGSRSYTRSCESLRNNCVSGHLPVSNNISPDNKLSINSSMQLPKSVQLPPDLQQLLQKKNVNFTMRIREMHYDINLGACREMAVPFSKTQENCLDTIVISSSSDVELLALPNATNGISKTELKRQSPLKVHKIKSKKLRKRATNYPTPSSESDSEPSQPRAHKKPEKCSLSLSCSFKNKYDQLSENRKSRMQNLSLQACNSPSVSMLNTLLPEANKTVSLAASIPNNLPTIIDSESDSSDNFFDPSSIRRRQEEKTKATALGVVAPLEDKKHDSPSVESPKPMEETRSGIPKVIASGVTTPSEDKTHVSPSVESVKPMEETRSGILKVITSGVTTPSEDKTHVSPSVESVKTMETRSGKKINIR